MLPARAPWVEGGDRPARHLADRPANPGIKPREGACFSRLDVTAGNGCFVGCAPKAMLWRCTGSLKGFGTFPQEFEQLLDGRSLRTLALSSCGLGKLPAAIARHSSLKTLGLMDCGLSDVPLGAYLERLESLHLNKNRFTEVPLALLAAPQLRNLVMHCEPPTDKPRQLPACECH